MEIYLKLFLIVLCLTWEPLICEEKNIKENNDNESNSEIFVPTSEWQPLKKGVPIPRGLHVRMNLYTGEREAKLLDPNDVEEEDKGKSLTHVEHPETENPKEKLSWEKLKDALSKMDDKAEHISVMKEDIERVKRKFRSYSDLKRELGDVKLEMKTELEVLNQLMDEYKEVFIRRSLPTDTKELEHEESLLSHLEYLVHKIDNANHFIKFNGIKEIVFNSLNSTSRKVRYEATVLLGSAVQNNPKAQINALEMGAVTVLLRTLALDSQSLVRSGALYAIGCMIRNFPTAQAQFLDKGGLPAVIKLFDSDTSSQLKMQVKALTLIKDLIDEVQESEQTFIDGKAPNYEIVKERARQHSALRLKERLQEAGWCQTLIKTLSKHSSNVELVEVLMQGMISMADHCSEVFHGKSSLLSSLADMYKSFIGQEDHDYLWVHSLFTKLSRLISRRKDEL